MARNLTKVIALGLSFLAFAPLHAAFAAKKVTVVVTSEGKEKKYHCIRSANGTSYLPVKKSDTSVCKKLSKASGKLGHKKIRLSDLPSSTALAGGSASSSVLTPRDVSGTPPSLLDLAGGSVSEVFWTPGVVSAIAAGTANESQCRQFFKGANDGESGGLGACFMAQSVGFSFQDILHGETALCYMKNAPTQANIDAGGISLVSGSLPGGDITKLFSVPAGSANRVVKVPTGPQTIFVRVYSQQNNTKRGNVFAYDLWFCNGEAQTTEIQRLSVSQAGQFRSETLGISDSDGTTISNTVVTAFVKVQGSQLVFDDTKDRNAANTFGDQYQGLLVFTSDGDVRSKVFDRFGGDTRKAYTLAQVSAGSTIQSLRFLRGAYKDVSLRSPAGGFSMATQYRDTYYASAPTESLLSDLANVDLATDAFYQSFSAPVFDTTGFDCSSTADIVLNMDLTNPTLQQAVSGCEQVGFEGGDFCSSDQLVAQAASNYSSACSQFFNQP